MLTKWELVIFRAFRVTQFLELHRHDLGYGLSAGLLSGPFTYMHLVLSISPDRQLLCSIVLDACRCSHAFCASFVSFFIRIPFPGAALHPRSPRFHTPQHQQHQQTPPSCLLHSFNPPPALALPETQIARRIRGGTQTKQLPVWTPRRHGGDGLAV